MDVEILHMVINGPGVVVPLSPTEKLEVPDPIEVRVTTDRWSVELVVRADRETLVPGFAEIRSIKPLGDRLLPNDVLRSLGLGQALEEIIRRAGQRYVLEDNRWVSHWLPPFPEPTPQEVRKVLSSGRRQVAQEEIERAAEVYRDAVAAGRRDATMAVAEDLVVSRASAARRVEKARAQGLLGAAAGTKAGERS